MGILRLVFKFSCSQLLLANNNIAGTQILSLGGSDSALEQISSPISLLH